MARKWNPTPRDYEKAFEVFATEGTRDIDIMRTLQIGRTLWQKWKKAFHKYFERRFREEKKKRRTYNPKGGRPKGSRKLTFGLRRRIINLLENDMTIEQTAKICHISKVSIYNWKEQVPAFAEEVEFAKEFSNIRIKNALKRRALGMRTNDYETTKVVDRNGRVLLTKTKKKSKGHLPSVHAAEMVLVNQAQWAKSDKQAKTHNKGAILEALEKMTDISEEEMEEFDNE
jgi:transposase